MKYKLFHISTVLLILCITQLMIQVKAIIGSNVSPVYRNEFPSIVCLIVYDPDVTTNENLLCTGTLITRSLVLTTGHCFTSTIVMIEVIIKNHLTLPDLVFYPIWWINFIQWAEANNHPIDYGFHDVAVMKIFGILNNIVPARVSRISSISRIFNLDSQMVGCGRTTIDNTPPNLKKATVKLISRMDCCYQMTNCMGFRYVIPPTFVCSGSDPYALLESGDSGGPIFHSNTLVGLNVGIYPSEINIHNSYKLNAHVNIDFYMHFIESHMRFR